MDLKPKETMQALVRLRKRELEARDERKARGSETRGSVDEHQVHLAQWNADWCAALISRQVNKGTGLTEGLSDIIGNYASEHQPEGSSVSDPPDRYHVNSWLVCDCPCRTAHGAAFRVSFAPKSYEPDYSNPIFEKEGVIILQRKPVYGCPELYRIFKDSEIEFHRRCYAALEFWINHLPTKEQATDLLAHIHQKAEGQRKRQKILKDFIESDTPLPR